MKKGYYLLIVGIILLVLSIVRLSIIIYYKVNSDIPSNYIALFHGGAGEVSYETYIYKTEKGYEYINVTFVAESFEDPKIIRRIDKKGKFKSTYKMFEIAKNHKAYAYVTLPNDSNAYSILEYKTKIVEE